MGVTVGAGEDEDTKGNEEEEERKEKEKESMTSGRGAQTKGEIARKTEVDFAKMGGGSRGMS